MENVTAQFAELQRVLETKHAAVLEKFGKLTELDQRLAHVERIALKPGISMADGEPGVAIADALAARFIKGFDPEAFRRTRTSGRIQVGSFHRALKTKVVTPITTPEVGARVAIPGLVAPQPIVGARQLLPTRFAAQGSSIDVVRLAATTGTAAVAPETTQKAELSFDLDPVNTPFATIAAWTMASQQVLSDAAWLAASINGLLLNQLKIAEENYLLNDATSGLLVNAPAVTIIAGTVGFDAVLQAFGELSAAGFPPSGVVLNPMDLAALMGVKDSEGRYITGGPLGAAGLPSMWGYSIAPSAAMPAGEFLAISALAGEIVDRMEASVLASSEDRDNFIKNMVTLLAEERLALALYAPSALRKGALGLTTTARSVNGNGKR